MCQWLPPVLEILDLIDLGHLEEPRSIAMNLSVQDSIEYQFMQEISDVYPLGETSREGSWTDNYTAYTIYLSYEILSMEILLSLW